MSSWNYRVVRKSSKYQNSEIGEERVDYSYGIHEAYYDDNRHVGMITESPVEPFGETIEELRHCWLIMVEAFGQPILDFDQIPEPGYNDQNSLLSTEDDENELLSMNDMNDLFANGPDYDESAYQKEHEKERRDAELYHQKEFNGILPLRELIAKVFIDYERKIKSVPAHEQPGN